MAARKNTGGKPRKKTQAPSRKNRLWVRDGLNLLAGLLLGALGLWLFEEYQENRAARAVARKYLPVVLEIQPELQPLSERYLELTQGQEGGAVPDVRLDADRPVCSLDPLRGVVREACALPPETASALLEFARNLHKAEMLRKLLQEYQRDPGGLSRTLSNQLLVTVHDESRDSNTLCWKLRESAGKGAEEAVDGTNGKEQKPAP